VLLLKSGGDFAQRARQAVAAGVLAENIKIRRSDVGAQGLFTLFID